MPSWWNDPRFLASRVPPSFLDNPPELKPISGLTASMVNSLRNLPQEAEKAMQGDPLATFNAAFSIAAPMYVGNAARGLPKNMDFIASALGAGPRRFDPKRLHPVEELRQPFFSRTPDFVESLGDKPLPVEEVAGRVRNVPGLKSMERNSVLEFLRGKKGKVEPKEIQDYIKATDKTPEFSVDRNTNEWGWYSSMDNPLGGDIKTATTLSMNKTPGQEKRADLNKVLDNVFTIADTPSGDHRQTLMDILRNTPNLRSYKRNTLISVVNKYTELRDTFNKTQELTEQIKYPTISKRAKELKASGVDFFAAAAQARQEAIAALDSHPELRLGNLPIEEYKDRVSDYLYKSPIRKRLDALRHKVPQAIETAIDKADPVYTQKQHPGLYTQGKTNLSFARQSDLEATLSSGEKVDASYVHELQSDYLDDLRKLGPEGGSRAKDLNLAEQFPPESKQHARLLRRASVNSPYNVPELWPGAEFDANAIQQLSAKAVIWDNVLAGKKAVVFRRPIRDDGHQPQLYQNLENNLKAAIRDLGPEFTLTLSKDAKGVSRPTVVFDPEAAKAGVSARGIRLSVLPPLPGIDDEKPTEEELNKIFGVQ